MASIKSIHGLRAYEHVHFSSKVRCHALTLRSVLQTVYREYDYSRKSPNSLRPEGDHMTDLIRSFFCLTDNATKYSIDLTIVTP